MNQPLLSALRFLGDAAKTMIIASAMLLISLAIFLSSPSVAVSSLIHRINGNIVTGMLVLAAVLTLTSLILILVSIYSMLIHSAYYFAAYKRELGIVSNYIKWGFIIGLVLVVAGLFSYVLGFIIGNPWAIGAGLPLTLLGTFILWLGGAGLSVLCFKLYEDFKSVTMLIAGIAFLIMGAISLVSWVLIHIETRGLIHRIGGEAPGTVALTPPPPPPT